MKLDLGFVETGEGHTTWRLPGLKIVDGKPQARLGWLAEHQGNGSTHILGGLIKTDSTKVRKAKAAERAKRRKEEQDALDAYAKGMRNPKGTDPTPPTEQTPAPAGTDVWGSSTPAARPVRAKRGQRQCGQLTEDGTPCERPWSATGCGVDHTAAAKALKARTKVASRGVPRSQAAAPRTAGKRAASKAPASKTTPRKRSGGTGK